MSESLNPLMGPPQAYVAHPGHGSVGPVIGVLAAITVLGIIAIIIGRLCSGHRVMGRVGYDMEGWVETKCASCIDGRVDPPPPPPPPRGEEPPQRVRRARQQEEESGGDSQAQQSVRPRENARASGFVREEDNNAREPGRDEREMGEGRARTGSQDPSENV